MQQTNLGLGQFGKNANVPDPLSESTSEVLCMLKGSSNNDDGLDPKQKTTILSHINDLAGSGGPNAASGSLYWNQADLVLGAVAATKDFGLLDDAYAEVKSMASYVDGHETFLDNMFQKYMSVESDQSLGCEAE